jgi:hypothetical protein
MGCLCRMWRRNRDCPQLKPDCRLVGGGVAKIATLAGQKVPR